MNTYDKSAWEKKTIIKDMVHGYIEIPKPIMREIVDTEEFQRLKDIEQTGMEALYPSATHKRFTHSLGVFHLAEKAFREFRKNVEACYPDIYGILKNKKYQEASHAWDRWQVLFTLAALLHDCGHSPFSHTLEFIYDLDTKPEEYTLNARLMEDTSESFQKDMKKNIDDKGKQRAKAHERMSAFLIKAEENSFRSAIKRLLDSHAKAYEYDYIYTKNTKKNSVMIQEDIEFMLRMIMGCRYDYEERGNYSNRNYYKKGEQKKWHIELQLRNCVIGMLNSQLDVDSLDYVVRDSKFSGYASHTVDLERLLSSFTIVTAVEVNELKISEENQLDYCINLRQFKGSYVRARVTGACHMLCNNANISAVGNVILKGQEEVKTERKQRVYQTSDQFSAMVSFPASENLEGTEAKELVITKPKNMSQKNEREYAYLHIRGTMRGKITGVIFTNGTKQEEDWRKEGNLKIEFAYEQKCMSVLMSAIYNSNFEKKWIYAHHISTFVNNYLYIYLLEQYAKPFVRAGQEEFLEKVKKCIKNVKYVKDAEDTPKKEVGKTEKEQMFMLWDSWDTPGLVREKKALKKRIDETKEVCKLQVAKTITDLIKILSISGWSRKVSDIPMSMMRQLYEIANNSLNEGCALSEEHNFDDALRFCEKHPQISVGTVQMFPNILAMYDPFEMEDQTFYRTSDRDLLAAYKKLYLEQKGKMNADCREFIESYEELVTRKYLSCLWKSAPEYESYLSDWTKAEIEEVKKKLANRENPEEFSYCVLSENNRRDGELNYFQLKFWTYMKRNWKMDRVVYVQQTIRTKKFVDYDMYMRRGGRVIRLKDVKLFEEEQHELDFFYIYYRQKKGKQIKEADVSTILGWLKNEMWKEEEEKRKKEKVKKAEENDK